jgi:hypothetical protein
MRPSRINLLLKTLMLVIVTVSGLALAADSDPPAQVGRISIAEGQVAVRHDDNEEAGAALVNWPVTSGSRITTGRGALAEFRVGSAALRLAGDSELEVTQLDDDNFRLRLNYGSAGVRISKRGMLSGFELLTDQARVRLTQAGWVRVDAERGASVVSVFAGMAEVDGGGSRVAVAAGKRAEMRAGEMRLGALRRDDFDNWPQHAAAPASRYVTDDVTGYEELDRYGNWRIDPEYGPLWLPRSVPADWAPYRDGRWIWFNPWGWTWVDNAPWGYAPSHYGRWVLVQRRWAWAPGSFRSRPAWAPALVGWVGGPQWQVAFAGRSGKRTAPGVGWFPLSPRERYVPAYRVSSEHERRLDWRNQRSGAWRQPPLKAGREGLTVVPGEQFRSRGTVAVSVAPRAVLSAGMLSELPVAPAPAGQPARTGAMRWLERNQPVLQQPRRTGAEHMVPSGPAPAPGAAAPAPSATLRTQTAVAPAPALLQGEADRPASGPPAAEQRRGPRRAPQPNPADEQFPPAGPGNTADQSISRRMRQAAPPASAEVPAFAGEARRPERNQDRFRQSGRAEPAQTVPPGATPAAPIAKTPAWGLAAPTSAATAPAALQGQAEAPVSGAVADPRRGLRRTPQPQPQQPNPSGARKSVPAWAGNPADPAPARRARETPPQDRRIAQPAAPQAARAPAVPAAAAPASAAPAPRPANAPQAVRRIDEHKDAERERKEAPRSWPLKREE